MTSSFVDLSHSLQADTPTATGAPPVTVDILEATQDPPAKGRRSLNVTGLKLMVHTGTHMDAPFHFYDDGWSIERVPLDRCVGPALQVKLQDLEPGANIDLHNLPGLKEKLRDIRKVVLNTGWARKWGQPGYFTDHPRMTAETAQFLLDCGVHLVGVDMPSVDRSPFPAHHLFLGNGCVIVENLTNLDSIAREEFQLIVLPLRITGRDGSPVRAVANCS